LQKPVCFYRRAAATHSNKMFQGNTPHIKLQKPVCLYRRAAATHSNKMFQGKTVCLNRRPPRHTAHNPFKNLRATIAEQPQHTATNCFSGKLFASTAGPGEIPNIIP
jgi:hypothetical protein